MKLKRAISIILLSFLIFSIVGCGNSDTPAAGTKEAAVAGSTVSTSSTASADPFGKYAEPIELTYAKKTTTNQTFPDGDNYDNNVWSRLIEEKLGIKLKIAWSADGDTDAYKNKLNVQLASGDLPDLIEGDYKMISMANEAGLLADLAGAFDTYASPYVKNIREQYGLYFDVATLDGKLMAIPYIKDPVEINSPLLWIRDDWMKKLGLDAPKTFNDVINIAEAFTNKDPDGNGKKDTYGLGVQQKLITGDFGDISGVAAAFGALTIEGGMWYRDDSGNIVNGSIQPQMKDALKALQDMYNAGLIDKEFGIKDVNKLQEDVDKGKIGMMFGANWNSFYPYANILKTNPEAIFKPYPVVSASDTAAKVAVSWPITDYYAITSNCKNPEAVIKLLNLYGATNNDEASAEAYEKYDNNNAWQLSPVCISDPQQFRYYKYIKDAIDKNDGGSNMPNGPKTRYDQVMAFAQKGDPSGFGQWGQIGPEGSASVIQTNYIDQNRIVVTELRGKEPEELVDKKATLEKIQVQAFTEIIMGGDINLFDKFVKDWNDAGGAVITKAINELYKK